MPLATKLPLASLILALSGAGSLPLTSDLQCQASCDELGRCMPIRFVWGAMKAGSTSIFDMLSMHGACGTITRFTRTGSHPAQSVGKENHYISDTVGPSNRDVYVATYPTDNCKSLCHVDATGGMVVPIAAAKLRSMMTSLEAVGRPLPLLPVSTCSALRA